MDPLLQPNSYWQTVRRQFLQRPLGCLALFVVVLFCLVGIFAPFLASSKPLVVVFRGRWYFPLFRYLFNQGFYTTPLDLFFNLMIFTLPSFLLLWAIGRKRGWSVSWLLAFFSSTHCLLFVLLFFFPIQDPAVDPKLNQERHLHFAGAELPDWDFELRYMTDYAKLNLVLQSMQREEQHRRLQRHQSAYREAMLRRWLDVAITKKEQKLLMQGRPIPERQELKQQVLSSTPAEVIERETAIPSLWQIFEQHRKDSISHQTSLLSRPSASPETIAKAKRTLAYLEKRQRWQEEQSQYLTLRLMPLLREFHWEEDAGGEQSLNQYVDWWELSRINRKDLVASLIFGVRISLVVGLLSVGIALAIGIPVGAVAGYYGGKFDIVVCRMLEIWESMPTLFMLLLITAVVQSKSIFLIIFVIGVFGWTSFSRYIRAEFFKQRNLCYVEACHSLGFNDRMIIFSHILPNAIPPLLTLLPFAIMGAITTEAALSFLGLGEEGSCSWGVLMDEGRSAFPAESYLLWPPAILLTLLLVAIALVGDTLRDVLDPKLHK